jgi:3-hydroxyisobutyrate dehydrogenase-like beta-hydroxyacid dehydrogenase
MSGPAEPFTVSLIGTGTMGSALARALLRGGSKVTVWNRTAARAEPLREEGAIVAGGLVDALSASDVTIMCVADQAVMRGLLAEPGALDALGGRTLVQLTTGAASDGRRNAAAAAERGIGYLDGVIMAYPRTIGTADGVILYAGASETFAACEALLGQLGTARYVGEDAGRPAVLDAGLIALFYGTLIGLLHGAVLADAENIELDGFFELASPFFAGFIADAVRETMERIVARHFDDAQSSMHMHLSGIDHLVVGASREAGIDHRVMDEIHGLFAQAVSAGRGDDDIAVLFDVARARRATAG